MSTTQPTNSSEWQLYRVLQRANLLQYYDTFVAQGGDDVPQLCEAGEEEFLEIMALVGMASKPLHVRRLQKALQEWVANPAAFQGDGGTPHVREPPTQVYSIPITSAVDPPQDTSWTTQGSSTPVKSVSPVSLLLNNRSTDIQSLLQQPVSQVKKRPGSPQPPPVLLENQITEIARIATQLAKTLPHFDVKPLNMKKDVNKQIFELINLSKDHPERLELMRKYGAIYRRFDSQRVYEKSMSLHEVCVNEAAAQLCFHVPNLLTRREDLFPLARQVVKDSGYQYSKGHSRSSDVYPLNPNKKAKLDFFLDGGGSSQDGMDRTQREERLGQITKELSQISEYQEKIVGDLEIAKEGSDMEKIESLQTSLEKITNKHLQLLTEQSDLLRKQSSDIYDETDASLDRDDSNFGGSGSSSPAQSDKQEITAPHAVLRALFSGAQGHKTLKGGPGMKNTLFDEGLRIAQQYGLGDFAEELQTLKDTDPEEPCVSVASLFPGTLQVGLAKSQKSPLNGTSAYLKTENGEMQGTITDNGDGNQFIPKSVKVEPDYKSEGEPENGS